MILCHVPDLIFASRIAHAASDLGLISAPLRSAAEAPARLKSQHPVTGVIVALESEQALEVIAAVRRAGPEVRIVGFGPHVDQEVMKAARLAGADDVYPRSRFAAGLGQIMQSLAVPK